ncbi:MAG: twin-arginine translocation signal domain-containing protein, partial [Thermomicrobiales bacterium]
MMSFNPESWSLLRKSLELTDPHFSRRQMLQGLAVGGGALAFGPAGLSAGAQATPEASPLAMYDGPLA